MAEIYLKDTTRWNKGARFNKSGNFPAEVMQMIEEEASKKGLDPKIPQAIAWVETNFGKDKTKEGHSLRFNPMRLNYDRTGMRRNNTEDIARETFPTTPAFQTIRNSNIAPEIKDKAMDFAFDRHHDTSEIRESIKDSISYLQRGFNKHPKNLTKAIQFYNGEGILPAGYYGSKKPIDMKRNPVYGKKILDYVQALKDNR